MMMSNIPNIITEQSNIDWLINKDVRNEPFSASSFDITNRFVENGYAISDAKLLTKIRKF